MIRIITQKRLDGMLKGAYNQGLELRKDIDVRKMDRDIREIQKRKAVDKW